MTTFLLRCDICGESLEIHKSNADILNIMEVWHNEHRVCRLLARQNRHQAEAIGKTYLSAAIPALVTKC